MYRKTATQFVAKVILLSLPVMVGFAVVLLVAGWILFGQGEGLLGQSEERQIDVEASLIRSHLKGAASDLRYVANGATMYEWLDAPTAEHFHELEYDFCHLVEEKNIYLQARVLGVDGMELVRVDATEDGEPRTCNTPELQLKNTRQYFAEAMKMKKDEVFISSFNLNVERGEVEIPFKPTVRLSTPLFDAKGERRGVLVFNLKGDVLIGGLKSLHGERGGWGFYLVNKGGYWLVGPSPEHEWGFQLPSRAVMTLPNSSPRAWEVIRSQDAGRVLTDNGLILFTSIFPQQIVSKSPVQDENDTDAFDALRDKRWVLIGQLPKAEVSKYFSSVRFPLYVAFAVGSLIILVYALVLSLVHTRLQQARRRERNQSIALGESVMNLQQLIEINDQNIAELRDTNSRLQSVLSAATGVAVVATDTNGLITLFNPGAENMLGYTAEEMVGVSTPEPFLVPEEMIRRGEELTAELGYHVSGFGVIVEAARREGFESREWTCVRKDGSRINVEQVVTAIRNDVDGITGYLGIAVDVTERNRALRELENSRARLNSIVETAADGIFTVGTDGIITSVNRSGAATFGYSRDELVGRNVRMLMTEPHSALHDKYIETFLKTGKTAVMGVLGHEVPGKHRDGHEFPLELSISEVSTESEHFFTGILRDITKRKQAEEALRKAHEALVLKQQTLDDDLNAAAIIQRNLLPQRRPTNYGFSMDWLFLPSTQIGGDVFNVLPLPDGQLGLYLLDVSGHGPAAAMVTVSISQVLQPESEFIEVNDRPLAPDEVLRRVDREFPLERFERFCTMVYMTYDPATRTLRSSGAGHPPPLLACKGGPVVRLDEGGTVIGMGEPVPFVTEELTVEPGDVLLLYTDGCTEHADADGEQYGVSRLEKALSRHMDLEPRRILEELLEELDRFGDHAKPEDDISMVCLKFS